VRSILTDEFNVNRSTGGGIENDGRAITTVMTMAYTACHSLNPTVHNCFPIRYRCDSVPIALFSIPCCAPRQQAARIDRYTYTEANSTGGSVRRSLYTFPINRKEGELEWLTTTRGYYPLANPFDVVLDISLS